MSCKKYLNQDECSSYGVDCYNCESSYSYTRSDEEIEEENIKNYNKEYKIKGSLVYSDLIRCKFKQYKEEPFYTDDNEIVFNNWESLALWLKNRFYDNDIQSVEIDLVDYYDIVNDFVEKV